MVSFMIKTQEHHRYITMGRRSKHELKVHIMNMRFALANIVGDPNPLLDINYLSNATWSELNQHFTELRPAFNLLIQTVGYHKAFGWKTEQYLTEDETQSHIPTCQEIN